MRIVRLLSSLLILCTTVTVAAAAQVDTGPSLGDFARAMRAERERKFGRTATAPGVPASMSQPRIAPAGAPAGNAASTSATQPPATQPASATATSLPAVQPAPPTVASKPAAQPAAATSAPATPSAPASTTSTPAAQTKPGVTISGPAALPSVAKKAVSDGADVSDVTKKVAVMMWRKDYAGIDKMADELRASKARFADGGWKLHMLYAQLATINAGANATDADWQQYLAFFKDWSKARPQSITARVALAHAYFGYAWQARGQGSADQVTEAGWKLFHERNQLAANTLMEARELPSGCPEWYLLFQRIGRSEGADKDELQTIFERAVAFEPDYYYFYQEYALDLLPKWAGEPGDMEKFAAETYSKVGGKKGAFLYFQIAASLCGECGEFRPDSFSWAKIQEGFAAMEEMYGVSTMKLNQYARLAAEYNDKATAAKAFERIGDNWDQETWRTRAAFDAHRAWAGLKVEAATAANAAPVMPAEVQQQVRQLMQTAGEQTLQGRLPEAATGLRKVIELTKDLPGGENDQRRAYLMLARNQHSQGQDEAAHKTLEEAFAVAIQKHGENSEATINAMDGKAFVEWQINDSKGAETDVRRAIAMRERAGGRLDVSAVMEYTLLGQIEQQQGRNQEAVQLLEPVLKRLADDPSMAGMIPGPLSMEAAAYQAMGKNDEAVAAYTRMLKIQQDSLPPGSPAIRDVMEKLAAVYHSMGRKADEAKIVAQLKSLDSAGAQ